MRAVMLQTPEELLAERRRKGLDRWDEVWDGVLHMVPAPSGAHQEFGSDLLVALSPIVKSLGLRLSYKTGLFRPGSGDRDYRQPDLVISKPEHRSERGVEGKAELVVEILSPGDESREKLGFYAACGVSEVLLIDPRTREFEYHVLRGSQYLAVLPDDRGAVRSPVLGVTFSRVNGPRLRISTPSSSTEI